MILQLEGRFQKVQGFGNKRGINFYWFLKLRILIYPLWAGGDVEEVNFL